MFSYYRNNNNNNNNMCAASDFFALLQSYLFDYSIVVTGSDRDISIYYISSVTRLPSSTTVKSCFVTNLLYVTLDNKSLFRVKTHQEFGETAETACTSRHHSWANTAPRSELPSHTQSSRVFGKITLIVHFYEARDDF